AEDGARVLEIAAGYDPQDAYSRPFDATLAAHRFGAWSGPLRLAVPRRDQLEFFGDDEAAALFDEALATWQALGATLEEVDISPLLEAARLLYQGPWVSERYLAAADLLTAQPEALLP